jgi:NADP-dependent 3-hydroxy acid dehydrogenase YdfG
VNAARQVGDLDILVNNAGIMVGGAAAPDADLDSFRRTYETTGGFFSWEGTPVPW